MQLIADSIDNKKEIKKKNKEIKNVTPCYYFTYVQHST